MSQEGGDLGQWSANVQQTLGKGVLKSKATGFSLNGKPVVIRPEVSNRAGGM